MIRKLLPFNQRSHSRPMINAQINLYLTVISCFLFLGGADLYAKDISVIVNNKNQLSDLSSQDLIKIFKSDKQFWKDGKKIYLILHEEGSDEKAVVLNCIYRMETDELRKFWLGKLYRGAIATLPKTVSSNEAIKRFISRVPNAIGVIDTAAIDGSVKSLSIDGKNPSDVGYLLATHP